MAAILSAKFRLTADDGLCVSCARWDSRGPTRGVIQIAHGMGEHLRRYIDTIDVLISVGLTVYGNDHRGHGLTARSPSDLGNFPGPATRWSTKINRHEIQTRLLGWISSVVERLDAHASRPSNEHAQQH
ncbi:alpha/beta hydrolase (plasmid) [Bradyrhizobium sp. CB82]|uniref:alpha/beta hydrolase n=1 Tax=Bradyrhizobium sp. CB82 TaxID=3039159 RepID=UPI0024B1D004|nr:alpha/beta hydrolase [Bradyrhizobium sp. CB82]WFU45697.1 alpha/beta hydrolase [Bradyrhizobium sp. CB82]